MDPVDTGNSMTTKIFCEKYDAVLTNMFLNNILQQPSFWSQTIKQCRFRSRWRRSVSIWWYFFIDRFYRSILGRVSVENYENEDYCELFLFRQCIEPSRQRDRCFHYILDGNYFSTSKENELRFLSSSPGFFKAVFLNCSLLNLYWEKYTQFILAFLCLLCAFLLGESSLFSEKYLRYLRTFTCTAKATKNIYSATFREKPAALVFQILQSLFT